MNYREYIEFCSKSLILSCKDLAMHYNVNYGVSYYDLIDDEKGYTQRNDFEDLLIDEIMKNKYVSWVEISAIEKTGVEIGFKKGFERGVK